MNVQQYAISCRPSQGAAVPRMATALLIGDQATRSFTTPGTRRVQAK